MFVYFGVIQDGLLQLVGGGHNTKGVEGVSLTILGFLNQRPEYNVDKMMVVPVSPTHRGMPVQNIPLCQFVEWDYRLNVEGLLVTLKQRQPDHVLDILMD